MALKITDTHAHLEPWIREGTLSAVLRRAREAGVERIICPSANPGEWKLYSDAVKANPGALYWQAGLHPSDVSEENAGLLDALPSYFAGDGAPVAVGEIGLDFHDLPSDSSERERIVELQRAVFARQLGFARDLDAPVCVHARGAFRECVDVMKEAGFDFSKAVFHCFAGSAEEVAELNALGGRASFTGIITFAGADEMRRAMLRQGLGLLMLETDCPFLAPVPLRGRRCEPAMIVHTVRRAAELFGVGEDRIAEVSSENARGFFGL